VALDVVAEAKAVALSVVAPCFNEQSCLREFHRRTSGACPRVAGDDYEIVLVDDGSRDGTWQIIQSLSETDPHVVGVHLMRNHGHQLAATAGLCAARGQRVMLIDADLQDPPELLAGMMQRMDQGADVVYGRRTARDGETWFKKASAAGFYRLLSRLANVPIPQDTGDFRLMRRRVVDALLAMPERERFLRGMVSWIGGNQVPFDYTRDARHAGRTKYSLGKMLRFGTDAVTSFSIAPLRFAVWLGLTIAGLAMLLLAYSVWRWLAGEVVTGWTSIMTAVALFAGVQLLVLGIIGEYLGRLVQEAKGRPLFLIDTVSIGGNNHTLPFDFWRMSTHARRSVLSGLAESLPESETPTEPQSAPAPIREGARA
jgi:polyisoprenyl-phosphate glycosyltransferase